MQNAITRTITKADRQARKAFDTGLLSSRKPLTPDPNASLIRDPFVTEFENRQSFDFGAATRAISRGLKQKKLTVQKVKTTTRKTDQPDVLEASVSITLSDSPLDVVEELAALAEKNGKRALLSVDSSSGIRTYTLQVFHPKGTVDINGELCDILVGKDLNQLFRKANATEQQRRTSRDAEILLFRLEALERHFTTFTEDAEPMDKATSALMVEEMNEKFGLSASTLRKILLEQLRKYSQLASIALVGKTFEAMTNPIQNPKLASEYLPEIIELVRSDVL